MKEEWRSVVGYEGFYEVSSLGRVRSLDREVEWRRGTSLRMGGVRKLGMNFGYLLVHLCREGKPRMFRVHRLVAEAFIPNPQKKPQVNHKNGKKTDNRVVNLEWMTSKENRAHGIATGLIRIRGVDQGSSKLTPAFIRKAEKLLRGKHVGEKRKIYKELTKEIGAGRTAIWLAITGRSWKHLNLKGKKP